MRTPDPQGNSGKIFFKEKSRIKSKPNAVTIALKRINARQFHLQHVAKETAC